MAEDDWRMYRYAVVDLEGSGAQDKEKEQILSIAIVTISEGKVKTDDLFYSLVKPEYPIKRLPWLKHNITNETVKDAPGFHELELPIGQRLRHAVFVAHNARIDWQLLNRYMPNLEVTAVLDTMKFSRKVNAALSRHRLSDLLRCYGLEQTVKELTGEKEHHALYDAVGTAFAFVRMVESLSPGKVTLSELMRVCAIETKGYVQGSLF